jgi:hypothetical protein
MCPIFNGFGDTAVWNLVATKFPRPYSFRFLSVGMDEKRSLQRKSRHKRRIGARIMNSGAFLKQERQDDLKKATRRVEKCIEVDGEIF